MSSSMSSDWINVPMRSIELARFDFTCTFGIATSVACNVACKNIACKLEDEASYAIGENGHKVSYKLVV